jgi:4-hydroxythreonine-4-phosphate dehydrogenase
VAQRLTTDLILGTARLATGAGRDLLAAADIQDAPHVGVCAFNPHASEQGLFGDEEQRLIEPAIVRGRAEGLPLTGPMPADTLLMRAAAGEFDVIVAMYHDQGHIALKLLGMHRAVNVTLGLPIVRTSVAHGTAFDLAWQGVAQTTGMIEAITAAARLVKLHSRQRERASG